MAKKPTGKKPPSKPVFPIIPPGKPKPKCYGTTGGIYISPSGASEFVPPCPPAQPPVQIPPPPVDLPPPPSNPGQPIGGGPVGPFPTPAPPPSAGGGGYADYPCPRGGTVPCVLVHNQDGWFCVPDLGTDALKPGLTPPAPGYVLIIDYSNPSANNFGYVWVPSDSVKSIQPDMSGCGGPPNPPPPVPPGPCDDGSTCGSPNPQPPVMPPQCDSCLDNALNAIAQAMQQIADSMAGKASQSCSQYDGCLDYLADKLKDKILPPAKTCDECCKRIEMGLATAVECAAVSANCTCQSCVDQCSSQTEGSCCTLPDGTSGTCQDDICVPGEQPQPPTYWIAWCNPDTGESDATVSDAPTQHDPPWQDIGHYPDFMSAAQAAQTNCTSETQPQPPTPSPGPPPPVSGSGDLLNAACNLGNYHSRIAAYKALDAIDPQLVSSSVVTSFAQHGASIAEGGLVGALGAIVGGTLGNLARMNFGAELAASYVTSIAGCSPDAVGKAIQCKQALAAAHEISGVSLPQMEASIDYLVNAGCRPYLPSPGEATAAYLANNIDDDALQSFFAAAGLCEPAVDMAKEASRAKYNPVELRNLYNRGIIGVDEYNSGMRMLGYLYSEQWDNLYTVQEVRPSLSEILHMMIRDADNAAVQESFNFDERFEDKFGPTLQQWTQDQQIPEEVVRLAYRSHWDIPSKQELFEFVRRLRNDPALWSAKGWEADLDAALTHNNILPHWFNSYKAIMFHPLGRIDIRRSYQQGTLTDDEAKAALSQLGYSDDNVDLQFKFLVRLKDNAALKHESLTEWVKGEIDAATVEQRMADDGFNADQINRAIDAASIKFANSDAARAFVRGELDRDSFQNYLSGVGLSGDNISSILDQLAFIVRDRATEKYYTAGLADRQTAENDMIDNGVAPSVAVTVLDNLDYMMEVDRVNRCKAAIRKQFLTGGLDVNEATQKLLLVGVVQPHADRIVNGWGCEKASKDKHSSATVVCGWLAKGAITSDDFIDRMVNIGFNRDDALLLLGDCSDRIQTQQAKKQAKEAADQAKAKRQAQQQADRAVAKGNRVLAQLEKARAEKVRLRKQRQTQFLQVAKNVEKKSLATPQMVVSAVLDQSNRLEAAGFTLDEALRILLQSSEALATSTELPVWFDLVDKFSSVVAATEVEDTSPEEPNISS